MADRVISVRLQFEIDQARRNARAMSDAVRGVAASAENAGKATAGLAKVSSALRGMGTAAASAGAVAAGGMAALTAKTISGGIAYNKLEQTSRAALTTLTGSASAANQQMETLREFGKTSPFPRQVWISAQQQLLAFGMEAEKIIPIFQAVQDAVAAAGGGGQEIAEITSIIAKIQSTGKVTAEELNELGYRGIDAATLIADAMGTTAGQVREDITSQAITGVQFIDQLTAAMSQRFAGAAANVKNTWAGTTDRVKGAIRDIGSLLATPLVDPEGGGAAVEWGNDLADALRAVESRLEPAIAALEDRMAPAVEAVSARIQDLAAWIKQADFSAIADSVRPLLPAIAGLTAGFTIMGAQSLPILDKMLGGLKPLPIALAAAAATSPELRQALQDLLVAAQPLLMAVVDLATTAAGTLGPAFTAVAALLQPVIAAVEILGNVVGALPGPVQMAVAGFVAWKALNLGSMFTGLSASLAGFGQQMKVQQSLAALGGQQIGSFGAAYSVAASKVSGAAMTMRSGLSSVVGVLGGPWGIAIGAGLTLLGLFSQETQRVSIDHTQLADTLNASTGAITANTRAFLLNQLETQGLAEIYRRAGGDAVDLVDAYLGVEGAQRRVISALEDGKNAGRINFEELSRIADALFSAKGNLENARNAQRDKNRVDEEAAAATSSNTSAQYGLADALHTTTGVATTATQQMQMLTDALGSVYEYSFAGEEAADGFQSGLHKLSNAFASNERAATSGTKAGNQYADSLKQQARIARDAQKQLRETQKQLEDLAEAQRKAEQEAKEAAKSARQRQLDEMFGKQFSRQSTMDAFRSSLARAGSDIGEARKDKVKGAGDLSGFTEGALANRDRMRELVQSAQAAIQAEKDSGASKERIGQVTRQLQAQLATEAQRWGLNAREVKSYTQAIGEFGRLANAEVKVNLQAVRKEFAEQRAEIVENSREQQANAREQIANSRETAAQAAVRGVATAATKVHTAALTGNSESAVENREMMRSLVKQAQAELLQLQLSGAGREELQARGEALARQLEREAARLGMNKNDVNKYTEAIKKSAAEVAKFPTLKVKADPSNATKKVADFVSWIKKKFKEIPKDLPISIRADRQDRVAQAAARQNKATGGYVSGPGGPTEDAIPAWLSNGEYVINARQTARNRQLLEQINAGAYAEGGYVSTLRMKGDEKSFKDGANYFGDAIRAAAKHMLSTAGPLAWAESQYGKPYIWGGVGPAGYDCSGFMSSILNVIQGRNPHSRRFATGNFPTSDFAPGRGNFEIGSFRGNPGHMAGTLLGVNVESRGSDGVVVGPKARGAGSVLFGGNVWHLKGFRDGGLVENAGDPPFDLLSPLGKHFNRLLGSYENGTDYVPMTGPYQLHRGEAVVPAAQKRPVQVELTVRGDGSRAADFVVDTINRADATGRLTITASRG